MNWWKKKDRIQYEFDKINNVWKFNGDFDVLEALFIDKYHWTHKEFMETPHEVIEILMLKRQSDAKAEKRRNKSLNTKKR